MTPQYFRMEEALNFIDEPNRTACLKILNENRKLFETIPGSTHNLQAWKSGYIEHY